MSDDDLQRMTYAELWLSELGPVVPEWRSPANARPSEPPRTPAPDDHDRPGQFTADATRPARRA